MAFKAAIFGSLVVGSALAYSVPSGVKTFYNNVKNGGCRAYVGNKSNLQDGLGNGGFGYCKDAANFIYLTGKNELGDMDIDCDGAHNCGGTSTDFQSGTAFDDILSSGGYGIKSLDASIHQFSVLGTCHLNLVGTIQPLALVAVVCNNQLFYSVWGDTNGCDNNDATGEASISLAQMCFPNEGLNGNNGHEGHDVLYMAFEGSDAIVGPSNANWKAKSASDFQSSLKAFGDSVFTKKFGGSAPSGNSGSTTPPPTSTCTWLGHCAGAACKTLDDCDGDLVCNNKVCGPAGDSAPPPSTTTPPSTTPKCSWIGHCAGATCKTMDDCDGDLICDNKVCGPAGGSAPPPATTTPPSTVPKCTWTGHCAGATCKTNDDCDGDLTCNNKICGTTGSSPSKPNTTPACSWAGHCLGATCKTNDDCSDSLICKNKKCASS
ncbi:hypothetical protein AA313_de0200589 [Arthrobotrys entomopaga]|nr:hypothetical protein AA313_de0200589 [Arthrobotrys entomopaga]